MAGKSLKQDANIAEQLSEYIVALEGKAKTKTVFIQNLRDARFRLNTAIPVLLEYEDDVIIATYYDLDEFGYGATEDEALSDLCKCIVECYIHMKENEKRLGTYLKRLWSHLATVIEEVE